ncbi:MAG: quinol:cytochrome C oxidoreductase, partial [Flavobacteriales bacterium]
GSICVILLFTHWLDAYLLVMPGTVHGHWHLSFLEIGMFLGFAGLFMYVALNALTKAPLVPKRHPYREESLELHY